MLINKNYQKFVSNTNILNFKLEILDFIRYANKTKKLIQSLILVCIRICKKVSKTALSLNEPINLKQLKKAMG